MGILDVIAIVFVSICAMITIIGIFGLRYNSVELEKENQKLKEELSNLRSKKVNVEYKKVKKLNIEKGDK